MKTELVNLYPMEEVQSFLYLLSGHVLGLSKTDIHLKGDILLNTEQSETFFKAIEELKQNKPIQYIIGETVFYDLPIEVNSSVLIPRPETEELVDSIVKSNLLENPTILDIGTGSGCIAIALAKNIKNAEIHAIDISQEALNLAETNAERNNVHIKLYLHDILKNSISLEKKFDIIVSNPPYVTLKGKLVMNKNVVDYEPHHALFVYDNDPLQFYKKIVEFSLMHTKKNGWIFIEINEEFGQKVKELFEKEGVFDSSIVKDINGKDRIIKAQKILFDGK